MRSEAPTTAEDRIFFLDVIADLNDILPGGNPALDFDHLIPDFFGVFDHDDPVALRRQHPACRNAHGFALAQRPDDLLTHFDGSYQLEVGGLARAGSESVAGSNGITVHCRAVKMGKIDLRIEVLGEDAAAGTDGRDLLGGYGRNLEKSHSCLVRSEDLEKGFHRPLRSWRRSVLKLIPKIKVEGGIKVTQFLTYLGSFSSLLF